MFLLPLTGAAEELQLTARMLLPRFFPPNRWSAVQIELINPSDKEIRGYVQIGEPENPLVTEDKVRLLVRTPIISPAHSRIQTNTYAYLPGLPAGSPHGSSVLVKVIWVDENDAQLQRSDFRAIPQLEGGQGTAQGEGSRVLIYHGRSNDEMEMLYNIYDLPLLLGQVTQYKWSSAGVAEEDAPTELLGYDGVRMVLIDGFAPDRLNPLQRQALLDYLVRGGTVVLAAPTAEMELETGWLAPYLPVQVVGWRQAKRISAKSDYLKVPEVWGLDRIVPMTEAIDAGGQVLLRDEHYVHVAAKRVGLGRVVFTSVPPIALRAEIPQPDLPSGAKPDKEYDPDSVSFWRMILAGDNFDRDWRLTSLGTPEMQNQLAQRIAGVPAPRWLIAAGVAGGYLMMVGVSHLLLRGPRRPLAFGASLVLGGAVSLGLIATETFSQAGPKLTGGRLATIDLGPEGGGRHQEMLVLIGADDRDLSLSAVGPTSIRPVVTEGAPVRIDLPAMSAPSAGVQKKTIERLWNIDLPVAADKAIEAVGVFAADGLELNIDNRFGGKLDGASVLYGGRSAAIGNLPAGGSVRRVDPAAAAGMIGEEAELRGDILREALAPRERASKARQEAATMSIAGWAEDAPMAVEPSALLETPPARQILVRAPVRIEPSPVGGAVRVDSMFVRMVQDSRHAPPVSVEGEEWNPLTVGGDWVVAFAAPREIGLLDVKKAVVRFVVTAQGHNIRFVRAGTREVLAEFTKPVGEHEFEFEPAEGDVDEHGWVLLGIVVQDVDSGISGQSVPPTWKVKSIRMSQEGVVRGAPLPPMAIPAALELKRPEAAIVEPVDRPKREPKPKPQREPKKGK